MRILAALVAVLSAVPLAAQGVPDSPKKLEALAHIRDAEFELFHAIGYISQILNRIGTGTPHPLIPHLGDFGRVLDNSANAWNRITTGGAVLTGVPPKDPAMPATIGGFDVVAQPIEAACFSIINASETFERALFNAHAIAAAPPTDPFILTRLRTATDHIAAAWRSSDLAARAVFEISLE